MAQITFEIPDALHEDLVELLTTFNDANPDSTSHGHLTVETMAAMFLQDVGHLSVRPGSWEAQNIAAVLIAHGYQL
ncbi:hypothetical protein F1188_16170 [Roseospira marina]|uniref:Uncharacterized protein n=1 Tax=Roseospira marina TaxID=140057 RepID=A0A5M6I9J5_9PROT|nr:hypothetical protein [Roseospira marina]KAA5604395.1 hypothetical protein F1188_16170 [Roseospira marina]MBB4315414.1 hypothetical protein [Roseospira marina]MBB5088441.1 hypothetical protein [Roseospira marina]